MKLQKIKKQIQGGPLEGTPKQELDPVNGINQITKPEKINSVENETKDQNQNQKKVKKMFKAPNDTSEPFNPAVEKNENNEKNKKGNQENFKLMGWEIPLKEPWFWGAVSSALVGLSLIITLFTNYFGKRKR